MPIVGARSARPSCFKIDAMKIHTIGFTGKSAEQFFELLESAKPKVLVDVRLNNKSQLAGFSKSDDLAFFLRRILNLPYQHRLELAPTQAMLDRYRKQGQSWASYEKSFIRLMEKRAVQDTLAPSEMDGACLLCSEHEPEQCHRRLVAEYLQRHWEGVEIRHLM
jgi:uncharacterized protein (DUF488 family)